MYQEQVPSDKHLDEPLDMLDDGRFVFECILAGNLQAFHILGVKFHSYLWWLMGSLNPSHLFHHFQGTANLSSSESSDSSICRTAQPLPP